MSLEADIDTLRDELAAFTAELHRIATPIVPRSYKTADAAAALGVDPSVVRKMIRAGHLATVTLPTMSEVRIPAAALDAIVAPDRWSTAPHLAIVATP